MEKAEGTGRLNACIECVFGYKARGNYTFLNISRWLEITKRECNELLLSMKNLQELVSSPFTYIASVIPCPLPGEVIRGDHFVLANLLKSIPGSSSQAMSAPEPRVEMTEGALVSFA